MLLKPRHQAAVSSQGSLGSPLLSVDVAALSRTSSGSEDSLGAHSSERVSPESLHGLSRTSSGARRPGARCGRSPQERRSVLPTSSMDRWRAFFCSALVVTLVIAFGGGCHLMGRYSMRDEVSAAAQQQFVVVAEPRMCVSRITSRFTSSARQAMVLCLRTGGCTAILRQHLTGRTEFCRTLRRTSPLFNRQVEEAISAPRWLYTAAVVGSCELYDWKLVAIHKDSGARTGCRTVGLHGFEFQFSQVPCPVNAVLDREPTQHLQEAAVKCLGNPACLHFARDLHTGETIFCGRRRESSLSALYTALDQDDPSSSSPTPDPLQELISGLRWIYGCRHGECPMASHPQDQSFVLNLPYSAPSPSTSKVAANPSSHLMRTVADLGQVSPGETGAWTEQGGAESLQEYTLVPGNMICKPLQVLAFGPTPSELFAAQFCLAEPHCTAFTRSSTTGETWFCQSYDRVEASRPGEGFVTAMRLGCEHFDSRFGIPDIFTARRPTCARPRNAPFLAHCPKGLHSISVFTDATWASSSPQLACDECASNGICKQLQVASPEEPSTGPLAINATALRVGLESAAQQHLASKALGEEENKIAGAINPSIFEHNGQQMIVFRSTEALRCKGTSIHNEWRTDNELDVSHSRVSLCSLQRPEVSKCNPANGERCRMEPQDCIVLSDPGTPLLPLENFDPKHMMVDDYAFVGPEDPRAFSFRGRIYVVANIGVVIMPWTWETEHRFHYEIRVRRQVLIRLDAEGRQADRSLLISIPGTARTKDTKNAVPIITEDDSSVLLVHSILPYRVCRLAVETGNCEAVDVTAKAGAVGASAPQQSAPVGLPTNLNATDYAVLSLNGNIRGGSPFVTTPWGFLGIVHRKQELEMGRLYSHKWALLSPVFPHLPLWISPSFRLPSAAPNPRPVGLHKAAVEDIQFASGLVVDAEASRATITYGVSDCFSALATVDLPVTELKAAAEAGDPSATLSVAMPEANAGLPTTEGDSLLHVRWDSPVTDLSGFATVSRAFTSRLLKDRKVALQILNRDASGGPEPYWPEKYGELYETIVVTNLNLTVQPDVTVRLHWPPNFQPVATGKLAVYLPWEFEVIPDSWVGYLNQAADEVWVPAEFVRKGFLRSGVDPSRVHVVGHGSPDEVCKMSDPRQHGTLRPARRSFRFLYHGGMLWRKGVDLLLQAYSQEFTVEDDVLLVMHSVYGDEDVYQHMREALAAMGPQSPRVHFVQDKLNASELSGLYSSADAFVHPSRSEGFGLGIVEAMAYGLPPILPAYGPPLEFVSNRTGFLFPSKASPCDKPPCRPGSLSIFSEDWTTSSKLMWGKYEAADLGHAMRAAYENPKETEKRGRKARRKACGKMSWDSVYETMRQRIENLARVR